MRIEKIYDEQEIKNKELLKLIIEESIQDKKELKMSSLAIQEMIFNEIQQAWAEDYHDLATNLEKMIQYLESAQFKSDFDAEIQSIK